MIIAIECRWRRRHTKNILENWMRRSSMLTLSIRRCVVVIVLVYDQISLFVFFFSFLFWFFFFCNSEIISHKGLGNSYVFFWLFLSSYKTAPNYSGRDGGKVSYSGLCLLYSFDYLPLRAKVFCVIQLIWKWCYCRKQVLQTGCDDQSLRLSDLQQQYEFKCNEIEVCTVPVLYLMIWSFGLITWDVNNVN